HELPFGPAFFPRLYQFEAHQGETYQISLGNIYNWDYTVISFTLDLCAMRVVVPQDGASVTGPTNLTVRVTPPLPGIEGSISHLVFRALTPATRSYYSYAASDVDVEPLPSDPLTGMFTNLQPNDY